MKETILELQNITKVYHNGVVANRNISISFKKGEIHSIVGENGAGKSTLMKIIYGIESPSDGQIIHKGENSAARWKRSRPVSAWCTSTLC